MIKSSRAIGSRVDLDLGEEHLYHLEKQHKVCYLSFLTNMHIHRMECQKKLEPHRVGTGWQRESHGLLSLWRRSSFHEWHIHLFVSEVQVPDEQLYFQ